MNIVGSICTDGAPAMLGNRSGFATLMKREIPEVRVTHCLLHQYALAVKTLPKSLQEVLSTCVKIVNVIRGRSLSHRLFQVFCESMDSEHTVLVYHTEVRWPSRGHVLQRIFELREEIKTFLKDQKLDLFSSFDSPELVQMLAYLTDIFTNLNEINIFLQGSNKNVVIAHEKLASFKAKIPLWLRNIEKGNLATFPSLEEIVEEHGSLLPEVATAIRVHLVIPIKNYICFPVISVQFILVYENDNKFQSYSIVRVTSNFLTCHSCYN
ncbi:protein ZBED8-like [Limulus polyphemus]|uniref:Protein ZBED8-like n=1 Tax=Limulus polyphemus TaxID=6850 RepID=A0ABM1B013_LIMPO|nr:protein ZBED8-like [Limulus polyphemus]